MNWTDDRVELLKKLWAEGLSASQIAAKLGGVSRNAVIGKVHRLKLSSRGRATNPSTRTKKSAKSPATPKTGQRSSGYTRSQPISIGATALQQHFVTEIVAAPALKPVEDVVIPISKNLKLVELTERTCKWPIGDPLHEDFHFCGNESAENAPYCTYHARLAFQPASERRKQR